MTKKGLERIKKLTVNQTEDLMLIYQMGRVASVSIQEALIKSLDLQRTTIIHIHSLSPEYIKMQRDLLGSSNFSLSSLQDLRVFVSLSDKIKKSIHSENTNINIITGFREPISHSISCFFHNLTHLFPVYDILIYDKKKSFNVLREIYLELLKRQLLGVFDGCNIYTKYFSYHLDLSIKFFDREIKKNMDIDLFSSKFDFDKNYMTIKDNGINLIVYNFEKIDSFAPILNNFIKPEIKTSKICIEQLNATEDTNLSDVYKYFIANIRFPDQILDYFYNSKYMNHFYPSQEINRLYKKWQTNPAKSKI